MQLSSQAPECTGLVALWHVVPNQGSKPHLLQSPGTQGSPRQSLWSHLTPPAARAPQGWVLRRGLSRTRGSHLAEGQGGSGQCHRHGHNPWTFKKSLGLQPPARAFEIPLPTPKVPWRKGQFHIHISPCGELEMARKVVYIRPLKRVSIASLGKSSLWI